MITLYERKNEYLRIGDIIDLLKEHDEYYNHEPWTLEQIFVNLDLLVGLKFCPNCEVDMRGVDDAD